MEPEKQKTMTVDEMTALQCLQGIASVLDRLQLPKEGHQQFDQMVFKIKEVLNGVTEK